MDAKKDLDSVLELMKSQTYPRPVNNRKTLWGSWWVVSYGAEWKLKHLIVLPKHRTSLQRHKHRNEIWITLMGEGLAEVGDKKYALSRFKVTGVRSGAVHRVSNTSPARILWILELQYGDDCNEEDIIRKILGGRFG